MTLLPDVSCSEVEPQEIRLHSLHEGENAGWLLGTRTPALFLPHCRRRGGTLIRTSLLKDVFLAATVNAGQKPLSSPSRLEEGPSNQRSHTSSARRKRD